MNIIVDINNNLLVETSVGAMSLVDAFLIAVKRDGRTVTALERDCGLTPSILRHASDRGRNNPSLRSLLVAFIEMGYEINVSKIKAGEPTDKSPVTVASNGDDIHLKSARIRHTFYSDGTRQVTISWPSHEGERVVLKRIIELMNEISESVKVD